MSIESVIAVGNLSSVSSMGMYEHINTEQNNKNTSFNELLKTGLNTLNQDIAKSEVSLTDYILDKDISTHELMISLEKAKHSMHVAVEVRNRLVEAYQTITRMQV